MNFASTTPSPKTPAVTFIEPPPHPPRKLKRGSLVSPWSLFRSKSGTDGSIKRRQTVLPTTAAEQTKFKRISRWWPPNRSASRRDKCDRRTAPPIPPRPEALYPAKSVAPNPLLRPVSVNEIVRHARPSNYQPLSSFQERPLPPVRQQLVDLDPDKRDSEFTRIHAEGWDRVIPKQWMEDQFSQTSSETKEERSVYSQDNGEEEAKRDLTSQLNSVVNYEHGFLTGEATLFDPLSDVQVKVAGEDQNPDSHVRKSQEQQTEQTTRWPFEGSIASSPTSSPGHHWLSSVRPPSVSVPSSRTQKPKMDARESIAPSQRISAHDETLRLSSEITWAAQTHRKRLSKSKSPKKVKLSHVRDYHSLIPPPLTLRPRTAASATTIQTQDEITTSADEVAIHPAPSHLQQQAPLPLNSSWTTILCAPRDSTSTIHQLPQNATTPSTRRESDRNKPLPLPPTESPTPQQSPVEIQNQPRRDSLPDTIDEILDLYYHRDSDSDEQDRDRHHDQDQDPASTQRTSSSTATASTIQGSNRHTPPQRPPRTPDTELTLASPPPSFGTNMPRGGPSRFVAGYPIFYDAGSYPELGHGRPRGNGDGRRRRSGRAVVTFVDDRGGTWI